MTIITPQPGARPPLRTFTEQPDSHNLEAILRAASDAARQQACAVLQHASSAVNEGTRRAAYTAARELARGVLRDLISSGGLRTRLASALAREAVANACRLALAEKGPAR
ncbi:hypothetical protein ACE7GA_01425 [Roseomonas sp. CCTCC AB2023176]|uniref:hypothetical protein n=1 Tax=Roseomonas sp. CCTCC AB2023176 TaxID=3342640 RepID=UPI0035DCC902